MGVPCPLDDEEVRSMLVWVVHLTEAFPEAVEVASKMRAVPLRHSLIPHDVEETNLVDRYPNELTKFLLHLNKCEPEPWFWIDFRGIIDKLLAKSVTVQTW